MTSNRWRIVVTTAVIVSWAILATLILHRGTPT